MIILWIAKVTNREAKDCSSVQTKRYEVPAATKNCITKFLRQLLSKPSQRNINRYRHSTLLYPEQGPRYRIAVILSGGNFGESSSIWQKIAETCNSITIHHGCFDCSISVIKLIDYVSRAVARACLATKLLGCYDGITKTSEFIPVISTQ